MFREEVYQVTEYQQVQVQIIKMLKVLKICILTLFLLLSFCACTGVLEGASQKCGKYKVSQFSVISFDTVYILDPEELREKRYVKRMYIHDCSKITCRDTLDGVIYEYGFQKNKKGIYLISEEHVEYYPYD